MVSGSSVHDPRIRNSWRMGFFSSVPVCCINSTCTLFVCCCYILFPFLWSGCLNITLLWVHPYFFQEIFLLSWLIWPSYCPEFYFFLSWTPPHALTNELKWSGIAISMLAMAISWVIDCPNMFKEWVNSSILPMNCTIYLLGSFFRFTNCWFRTIGLFAPFFRKQCIMSTTFH